MNSVKDMVKGGKLVKFNHFRFRDGKGELWYKTECDFEFPVPIEDVGDGKFLAEDRAMYFMRWINPHHKLVTATQQTS
jgi:hypothetical protein